MLNSTAAEHLCNTNVSDLEACSHSEQHRETRFVHSFLAGVLIL